MHRVIAVGIESEAMPEARLSSLPEGVPSLTLERKTGLGGRLDHFGNLRLYDQDGSPANEGRSNGIGTDER
jgi:hypothetical protein